MLATAPLASAHDAGFGIARYSSNGTLDRTFGSDGVVVVRPAQRGFLPDALALEPDGRILVAGLSSDPSYATIRLAIARYAQDGRIDEHFGSNGIATTPVGPAGAVANAVEFQSDGKILVAGTAFAQGRSRAQFALARYTSNGVLDATFGAGGVVLTPVGPGESGAQAMLVQQDGRIVLVGTAFSNGATEDDFALARYTPNGSLDPTFGTGGMVTTDFGSVDDGAGPLSARGAAAGLLPDGRIVVAGFTRGGRRGFAVARYLEDGRLDPGFGTDGKVHVPSDEPQVYGLVLQSNGDVVVAGSAGSSGKTTTPFSLLRFRGNGAPDQTFGDSGLVTTMFEGSTSGARALAVQPDGKLLTAGAKFGAPSAEGEALPDSGFALARYDADGKVDISFGSGGKAISNMGDAGATPLAIAVQPDGKIIVAGLVFFGTTQSPRPSTGFDTILQFMNLPNGARALLLIALVVGIVLYRKSR